jgi:hypothetical protein
MNLNDSSMSTLEAKADAELDKIRAEISNLEADTLKTKAEERKTQIEAKYAIKGVGHWAIEGIKIFAAIFLGLGGLVAAISGYNLASAEKERILAEKEKILLEKDAAVREKANLESQLDALRKDVSNGRARREQAYYALGDALAKQAKLNQQLSDIQLQLKAAKEQLQSAKGKPSDATLDDTTNKIAQVQEKIGIAKGTIEPGKAKDISQVQDKDDPMKGTTEPGNVAIERSALRELSVKNLFDKDLSNRLSAYAVLKRDFRSDPAIVDELLNASKADPTNKPGKYFVLVTLVNLDPQVLSAKRIEITTYLDAIPAGEDKIIEGAADLVREVLLNF